MSWNDSDPLRISFWSRSNEQVFLLDNDAELVNEEIQIDIYPLDDAPHAR